jgi:hypothetical protein
MALISAIKARSRGDFLSFFWSEVIDCVVDESVELQKPLLVEVIDVAEEAAKTEPARSRLAIVTRRNFIRVDLR